MTDDDSPLSSPPMAKGYTSAQRQAFKERFAQLMERRGLNQSEIIRRMKLAGFTVSTASMSQWAGGTHIPSHAALIALANILGTTDDYLLGRSPAGEFQPKIEQTKPVNGRDFPVYGSAEGGDGIMLLDNDPIEYAPRPGILLGVQGAFSVYVVNDSMSPAFDPGDRIHIHPARPVIPGSYVLFIRQDMNGNRHALIKKLVRATQKAWRVEQFNPPKQFDLPRNHWQSAFRIVGSDRHT